MRNRMLIWLLLGGGAFVLLAIAAGRHRADVQRRGRAEFAFSDRIQVVDIEGELVESRSILEQLKRYEDSNSVKAILLNIDSPGGGVAVSQEIYTEIKRLREKKDKIIVAYLSSTGASGALLHCLRGQQNCRESGNYCRQHRSDCRMGELCGFAAMGEVEGYRFQDRRVQGYWFARSRPFTENEKKVFSGPDRRHVRTIRRGRLLRGASWTCRKSARWLTAVYLQEEMRKNGS